MGNELWSYEFPNHSCPEHDLPGSKHKLYWSKNKINMKKIKKSKEYTNLFALFILLKWFGVGAAKLVKGDCSLGWEYSALAEDLNSAPSSHIRRFTTAYHSSSKKILHLFWLPEATVLMHVHIHKEIHIIKSKRNLFRNELVQ